MKRHTDGYFYALGGYRTMGIPDADGLVYVETQHGYDCYIDREPGSLLPRIVEELFRSVCWPTPKAAPGKAGGEK